MKFLTCKVHHPVVYRHPHATQELIVDKDRICSNSHLLKVVTQNMDTVPFVRLKFRLYLAVRPSSQIHGFLKSGIMETI